MAIQLGVTTLSGLQLSVSAQSDESVRMLKHRIAEKIGVSNTNQILAQGTKLLNDDEMLSDLWPCCSPCKVELSLLFAPKQFLVACGGYDFEGFALGSSEMLSDSAWASSASLTGVRRCDAAAASWQAESSDQTLILLGGYTDADEILSQVDMFECHDGSCGYWRSLPEMRSPRAGLSAAVLGSSIFVVGGCDKAGWPLNTAEIMDAVTGKWLALPKMISARVGCAAAAVDGQIFVVGGLGSKDDSDDVALASAEFYDCSLDRWQQLPDMLEARVSPGAAICGDALYVVGGCDIDGVPLASMEVFDSAAWTWRTAPSMSCRRTEVGLASDGHRLVVVGGFDGQSVLSSVESWEPNSDSECWVTLPSLSTARAGLGAAFVK